MRISDWSSDVCSSDLLAELARPTPDRLLVAAQALREGLSVEEIHAVTKYDPWFLERIEEIIEAEQGVCDGGLPQDAEGLRRLKSMGFSDRSEEHTSELQSLMRISYAVFCLKKKQTS